MPDVYVAAGSNVDASRNLQRALAELASSYGPLRISPAYRNQAVGFDGDDFINLAVGFATSDDLERVRTRLQQIEALCGRPSDAPKWAPRSMDLDILMYGDSVRSDSGIVLPRPDLLRRDYMLKPMADLAPELEHPLAHKTMRELWNEFDSQGHRMTLVELS